MGYKDIVKKICVHSPFFMDTALRFTKELNPRIFVFHRFCDSQDQSEHRVDSDSFEWQLQQLKKYCQVVSFKKKIQKHL